MDAKVKGEPGKLMMKADMIKACCDRAHGYGLKVAAHVQSPEGVRCAVENGVDSIEHGSTLTQREIDAFKKHNAVLVCTISPALPMAKSLSNSGKLLFSRASLSPVSLALRACFA